MPELPSLEERLQRILELIAIEKRPCRACGTPLYFVLHQNGRKAPYTKDGLNHFSTCPQAAAFKRTTPAKQLDFSGQETQTGIPEPLPEKKTKIYESPRRLVTQAKLNSLSPEQFDQIEAYKIGQNGSSWIVRNVEAVRLALGERA